MSESEGKLNDGKMNESESEERLSKGKMNEGKLSAQEDQDTITQNTYQNSNASQIPNTSTNKTLHDWLTKKNYLTYAYSQSFGAKRSKSQPSPPCTVMLFKSDLRTLDNPALYHASRYAKESSNCPLICLYIWSAEEWEIHGFSLAKQTLALKAAFSLRDHLLEAFRIPMFIVHEAAARQVPFTIASFCNQVNAQALFYNKQYEFDEAKRDEVMTLHLQDLNISTHAFHDQCIVPPGICTTQAGRPYTMFTPYKKCWLSILAGVNEKFLREFPVPEANEKIPTVDTSFKALESIPLAEDAISSLYLSTEQAVEEKAEAFIQHKCTSYQKDRDFPALEGATSGLSPYIALGMISAKRLMLKAKKIPGPGSECWISELCWRDFYRNIIVAFPHVARGRAFKVETERIAWSCNLEAFQSWCQGKTGVPIVDAGMRQLNATGWMHNRLRMITAAFLTKDLLINWQWGERYFLSKLIDGDFASNNGGWQWSASTGTDAQPYFRIFNPKLQAAKFDPKGAYVRKWIPELGTKGYPSKPIVEHDKARLRTLEAFKAVMNVK